MLKKKTEKWVNCSAVKEIIADTVFRGIVSSYKFASRFASSFEYQVSMYVVVISQLDR